MEEDFHSVGVLEVEQVSPVDELLVDEEVSVAGGFSVVELPVPGRVELRISSVL